MNFRPDKNFRQTYRAWLERLGVTYEEMGELVDAELEKLSPQERAILATFDWCRPGLLTSEQHDVLAPVLVRAVEQARRFGRRRKRPAPTS